MAPPPSLPLPLLLLMVPHSHGKLITTTHNYFTAPPLPMFNHQNSDHHKSGHFPMSPRISFSNDFAESAQYSRQIRPRDNLLHGSSPPPPPVSSDFEFSVSSHSMVTADELFCKGRFLPFKNNAAGQKSTTLREELLAGEVDDDHDNNNGVASAASRPPKGSSSTRWKGFLGLKKSHIGSKKSDKIDGSKCQPHQDISGNEE